MPGMKWSGPIFFSKSSWNPICGQIFGHQRANKANLRDLIAATGLVILLKLHSNCRFISSCDLEIWLMTSKNYRAPLLHNIKPECIISNASVNSNWSYCPETLNSCKNQRFFVPCDLEIWWMTLKNNRTPLLSYIKLCASFQSHL